MGDHGYGYDYGYLLLLLLHFFTLARGMLVLEISTYFNTDRFPRLYHI